MEWGLMETSVPQEEGTFPVKCGELLTVNKETTASPLGTGGAGGRDTRRGHMDPALWLSWGRRTRVCGELSRLQGGG